MWEREKIPDKRGSSMKSVQVPIALLIRVSKLPEATQRALRASLRSIYETRFDRMIATDAAKRMRVGSMYEDEG